MKKKLLAPIFIGFLMATVFLVGADGLAITGNRFILYTIKAAQAAGLLSINADTTAAQLITSDTAGNDVAVATSGGTTTISIPTASSTKRGALSSADWSTFNGKDAVITATLPLLRTTNDLSCRAATGSVSGCLSSADWTTFNGKQASGNYITALTGDVTASGPGSVAATVATVGTSSAANVHAAELLANAATNADTVSTIVKRDSNGDFTARVITSDAAAGTVAFRAGNASDTKPFIGLTGNDTRGVFALTDGSIKIQSTSTSYSLSVGNGSFGLSSGMKPILASTDGSVNMEGPLWEYNRSETQVGNTANTLTDLYSVSLGANAITNNKQPIVMDVFGTFAATANVDKQVKCLLGTDVLIDTGALAVITAVPWHVKVTGRRINTTTGKFFTEFWSGDPTNGPYKITFITSSTVTWATGGTIKCQGKGTSASDVLGEMGHIYTAPHN